MHPDEYLRRQNFKELLPLSLDVQNEWFKCAGINRPSSEYVIGFLKMIKAIAQIKEDDGFNRRLTCVSRMISIGKNEIAERGK